MKKKIEYYLDRDESSDWYVVPTNKAKAFEKWSLEGDGSDPPDGVVPVCGHPTRVTFPSFTIT